ncbi:saccharopine dehydrogenase NADP-binding domain-containing protein [Coprococcus sp. AF99-45]|uniref:saccharopine dehydrogenase NADP-binding domain-containing protein n=1 Tax=Coprococcus sp. AF99-45 TaxID=2997948 RepID=UPI0022E8A375|nr:saccharopine dehydrogenase NADP-binding domain-containing protein [Coprococcus sp. AF99-45]
MKKNIGILGATGLVGSSVLSALQGKGYALLIGARNQYKLQCLKEEFSTENIEIIQMDVFIPKQVEMFCSQCDVVINCTSGYVCALVAEWCLNDEISKGKAYNLDEIEGIQKFIESLPGEIKQNIVKL